MGIQPHNLIYYNRFIWKWEELFAFFFIITKSCANHTMRTIMIC